MAQNLSIGRSTNLILSSNRRSLLPCLERAGVGAIQRLIPLRISLSAPIFPRPPYIAFAARVGGHIDTCLATPAR